MSLLNRLKALAQTKGWRLEQSKQWAARFFPGPEEHDAAVAVRVLVELVGVGFEQLTPGTRFIEDLRMDELEGVELVMTLEEEFGFKMPDQDVAQIATLVALISYLHNRRECSVPGKR